MFLVEKIKSTDSYKHVADKVSYGYEVAVDKVSYGYGVFKEKLHDKMVSTVGPESTYLYTSSVHNLGHSVASSASSAYKLSASVCNVAKTAIGFGAGFYVYNEAAGYVVSSNTIMQAANMLNGLVGGSEYISLGAQATSAVATTMVTYPVATAAVVIGGIAYINGSLGSIGDACNNITGAGADAIDSVDSLIKATVDASLATKFAIDHIIGQDVNYSDEEETINMGESVDVDDFLLIDC